MTTTNRKTCQPTVTSPVHLSTQHFPDGTVDGKLYG
jgi:hypothetical protein